MDNSEKGRARRRDRRFRRNRPLNRNSPGMRITIPDDKVGKLIGHGGIKVTELEHESNAKISVTAEHNSNGTVVQIRGDENSSNTAKKLIEEIVKDITVPAPIRNAPTASSASNEHARINLKQLTQEFDRNNALKWIKFPKLLKNFYKEAPEITKMTQSEVQKYRLQNNNTVVDRIFNNSEPKIDRNQTSQQMSIPKPIKTFEHAFHPWPEILKELHRAGFKIPSPIQAQAWPALLTGEDVIGIAQTGTGKTLAFLLPALVHIEHQPIPRNERRGPNVLIMAPTRELALQIHREVEKYRYKEIKTVCLYGGGNRREQIGMIISGVQIVIATPGRLNDLVNGGHIDMSAITYLVLDEADKMLDMGFEPQLKKTLLDIRPDRQTVMTSATWPVGVRRLAQSYMNDPIQIYVGTLDLTTVKTVKQEIIIITNDDEDEKFNYFMTWMKNMNDNNKVIIFCCKKARVDHISSELVSVGIDCHALHGDRDQADREQAVKDICSGAVQVLVATDLASRGLDIQDVTHVFNYDFPRNISEYVHRVGRTGRAGRTGSAISFITSSDWGHATELIRILKEANQFVPPELIRISQRYNVRNPKKEN